jgi:hypothetical protein
MQRIAKALNVSEKQISRDLSNSDIRSELKHTKTASNPKGAGRPKGSAKRQRRTTQQTEERTVAARLLIEYFDAETARIRAPSAAPSVRLPPSP